MTPKLVVLHLCKMLNVLEKKKKIFQTICADKIKR